MAQDRNTLLSTKAVICRCPERKQLPSSFTETLCKKGLERTQQSCSCHEQPRGKSGLGGHFTASTASRSISNYFPRSMNQAEGQEMGTQQWTRQADPCPHGVHILVGRKTLNTQQRGPLWRRPCFKEYTVVGAGEGGLPPASDPPGRGEEQKGPTIECRLAARGFNHPLSLTIIPESQCPHSWMILWHEHPIQASWRLMRCPSGQSQLNAKGGLQTPFLSDSKKWSAFYCFLSHYLISCA